VAQHGFASLAAIPRVSAVSANNSGIAGVQPIDDRWRVELIWHHHQVGRFLAPITMSTAGRLQKIHTILRTILSSAKSPGI
jgi:hypothetical protein